LGATGGAGHAGGKTGVRGGAQRSIEWPEWGKVEIRVGPALECCQRWKEEGAGPLDLVFIDADKVNTPTTFTSAGRSTVLRDEPRVSATTIQTVGGKGYDGFLIALVEGA
jgi:hypothetical protein